MGPKGSIANLKAIYTKNKIQKLREQNLSIYFGVQKQFHFHI